MRAFVLIVKAFAEETKQNHKAYLSLNQRSYLESHTLKLKGGLTSQPSESSLQLPQGDAAVLQRELARGLTEGWSFFPLPLRGVTGVTTPLG